MASGASRDRGAVPAIYAIDTVHPGDKDGVKGIYHIHAVDQVTQWEIVAATPQISELWLLPVLEALLGEFPFVIRGFHSDNGSEFIHYTVARLLDKLLIEPTKSRAHRTGDDGLVESKHGAIVRKHLGFGTIAAQHAEAFDQFHRRHLNPSVNFHRPCAIAEIVEEPNGRRWHVYRHWATPFPPSLEIAGRDSHTLTAPTAVSLFQTRKEFSATGLPCSVQAHSLMRKCSYNTRPACAAAGEQPGRG